MWEEGWLSEEMRVIKNKQAKDDFLVVGLM